MVIGDVVGSRHAPDRADLDRALRAALVVANAAVAAEEPLAPTIGDEFQGFFRTAVDAVHATLLVRASMGAYDVRFGLGMGDVVRLGAEGERFRRQDGPAWWAARDAIEHVASGRVPKSLRTWLAVSPPEHAKGQHTFPFLAVASGDPAAAAVNAYLVTRDQLVSEMDDRDRRILLGLVLGRSVTEIAEQEGVTPSAVSQRSRRSGAAAVAYAHATLAGW
ncbi:MAG TPA: SatD family protein [Mycobacteriales bacterium]|nr:SatD family protein [Mycobacteriales bacterium]